MGRVMVGGGIVGAAIGAGLFRLLQSIGQIDTAIAVLYVLMLGGIGLLMAKEAVPSIIAMKQGKRPRARKRRHHTLVSALPMRWRFYRSGLYISPLAPFFLGVLSGLFTLLLGFVGGFILVRPMLILRGSVSTEVL